MGEESKQILAKMDSMERKITQVDEKMTQIDAKFNQMDTKITQIDAKINQMDTKMTQIEKNLKVEIKAVETRLSGEIGQVKTAVLEISDDVEAILDMYADQQLKINKLANKIKAG